MGKKVLYEDDTRRRSKEAPHPPQPTMYMQSQVRPHGGVYMKPNPQLLITSQPASQQPPPVKRPRSPSPTRSGIPAAYFRNAIHPGGGPPASSRYPATTAGYSSAAPTTAHSHYTSGYPGSAVVSVGGNHLSHEQEEVARAAKHIYLSPAAAQAASQQSQRSVYNDRAALHSRSLAGPPPAAAHSSVTASSVAAVAAAAAGIHNRGPGNIMARYNQSLPVTTSYSTVTLASAISNTPRLAHSQNGTGGPPIQHPTSRYYTTRD